MSLVVRHRAPSLGRRHNIRSKVGRIIFNPPGLGCGQTSRRRVKDNAPYLGEHPLACTCFSLGKECGQIRERERVRRTRMIFGRGEVERVAPNALGLGSRRTSALRAMRSTFQTNSPEATL